MKFHILGCQCNARASYCYRFLISTYCTATIVNYLLYFGIFVAGARQWINNSYCEITRLDNVLINIHKFMTIADGDGPPTA